MTHPSILASQHASQALHAGAEPRDLVWHDEAACAALAAQLAQALQPGLRAGGSLTLELHGTLGAGKTTFTRHLLRALGVQGRIKSPSYAVVEPHEAPGMAIHHFDFYRFNDPQEWEDAGFRDLFGAPGLKVVEWPEKAAGLLPVADLQMHIGVMGEAEAETPAADDTPPARSVRLLAGTPTGQAVKELLHG
ncbi:tRNA (adenosine(37)-N6)-threonylcarbamoyltransferase complex ATPase subunit type 1 TsaE [Aquabacterium sp.]|uniref:tRNA (adenosine(37)-N6)-threonylcarbamoyltransferase complex ATPase subunit type 1 TsaE n=1 Tax=Aquabacterium sp. TaxID=1872578 RepID=UPI002488B6F4|nr:tRNA (adenosine(37)-N6)-threonylcarbamoyltransferase complex ATPase subunit type 1 TsaE [Aquabacterium sp.]MDI1350447.1 tRNA (adenosine(37)-N6)-threonylcarbamoyltransferase complex ATPase subunit type 1 TsaE [Aquabacterium sp.]